MSHAARPAILIIAGCVLAALLAWWLLPPVTVLALMDEHGPVEVVTAITYALCAAAVWWARDRAQPATALAVALLLLGFTARELDLHKIYDGSSMLRASWYAGAAPLGAKVMVGAIVALFAGALLWLLRRHARAVWRGCRQGSPLATTVLLFVVTALAAKLVDRTGSVLPREFGIVFTPSQSAMRFALEESLELALSGLVVLALVQSRAARRVGPP